MAVGLRLRLIGTSDLHANVVPYDYYRDRPDETVGLARDRHADRAGAGGGGQCLLLDNGDFSRARRSATMPPSAAPRTRRDPSDDRRP